MELRKLTTEEYMDYIQYHDGVQGSRIGTFDVYPQPEFNSPKELITDLLGFEPDDNTNNPDWDGKSRYSWKFTDGFTAAEIYSWHDDEWHCSGNKDLILRLMEDPKLKNEPFPMSRSIWFHSDRTW